MQNQWDSSHHPYCKYQIEIFLCDPKHLLLWQFLFDWEKNYKLISFNLFMENTFGRWSPQLKVHFVGQEFLIQFSSGKKFWLFIFPLVIR